MKHLLLAIALLFSVASFGQKKKEKTIDSIQTKSGWVIYEGDEVEIGLGTLPDGRFKYIKDAGWNTALTATSNSIYNEYKDAGPKYLNNTKQKVHAVSGRFFNIKQALGGRLRVDVEAAIQSGELVLPEQYRKSESPKESTLSVADELTKLKKLYDDGILTKDEFEAQKKKLLNQ